MADLSPTETDLRSVFADTLDQGNSRAGIAVIYRDGTQARAELGVPYTISDGVLEIGPYIKNISSSPPRDYNSRKKKIPIGDIVTFERIDLSSLL